jgi:hypothetical protein
MRLLSAAAPIFAPVRSIVSAGLASVTSTANAARDNCGGTATQAVRATGRPPKTPDLPTLPVAPANHQLLLENDRVRVLLTTIPRGAITPVHTHRWPSVEYVLSTTNFVRRDADQNVPLDTRAADAEPHISDVLGPTLRAALTRERRRHRATRDHRGDQAAILGGTKPADRHAGRVMSPHMSGGVDLRAVRSRRAAD